MDKKILIAIAAVIVVGLAAFGGYWFFMKPPQEQLTPQQAAERELQALIESNIEKWDQYAKVTDEQYKKFGNDKACGTTTKGSPDFLSYYDQATKGDIYKLDLTNGAYMLYTPNYNNWDNAKLASLTVQDMRVCTPGWLVPLHAYPDKIAWANTTCADADEASQDNCQRIARIIMGYFIKKAQ